MLIVSALTCVLLAGSVTAQESEDAQPEEAVQENVETEAAEADYDYMILGQHWIGDEENEPYCGKATDDETVLRRFVDQTIEGMKTGLFTYLAHPDLAGYSFSDETIEREYRRLCMAGYR